MDIPSNPAEEEDDVDYLEKAAQIKDSAFRRTLKQEMDKQKFNECIHEISEFCWERCTPPTDNKLGSKAETCLENCVNRFIDVSKLISHRFSKLVNNSFSNESE